MNADAPTIPNEDWRRIREQPYTGPETGEVLSSFAVLEETAARQQRQQAATATREFPAYDGPYTGELEQLPAGDQMTALGTAGQAAIEEAAEAMAPDRGRHRVARTGGRRLRVPACWPLLAVLAVQAVLSLRLVWSNTAFMDEALYLSAGHLEIAHLLHGAHIPQYQTYFSGAPVLYPVLGAAADGLGGLAAARVLSCLFMLGAAALCYGTGSGLFGRRAGVAGAAVFAALGPVEFLGAFATYDAMALTLLALSAFLAVRARGRISEPVLIAAALVLATADATKYATALWDPVVIALVILTARGGRRAAIVRGARFAAYLAAVVALALRAAGHSYMQGILFTTVARTAGGQYASLWTMTQDTASWIGPVILLAAVAVAVAWRGGIRRRWLCGVLLLAILLAPLHQEQIHILTSLHKHVAFGAWFGSLSAGYVLAAAGTVNLRKGWRVAVVTAALIAMGGVVQAGQQFAAWPDVSGMMPALAAGVQKGGCPCLVMESNVAGYYLNSPPAAYIGPYYFAWREPPAGKTLTDYPAYRAAISAGYFRVIETDPYEGAAVYRVITTALAHDPGYRPVWSRRVRWGLMQVWERGQ